MEPYLNPKFQKLVGQKMKFTGKLLRKTRGKGKSVRLVIGDVKVVGSNEVFRDHVNIFFDENFYSRYLGGSKKGDIFTFVGVVQKYNKKKEVMGIYVTEENIGINDITKADNISYNKRLAAKKEANGWTSAEVDYFKKVAINYRYNGIREYYSNLNGSKLTVYKKDESKIVANFLLDDISHLGSNPKKDLLYFLLTYQPTKYIRKNKKKRTYELQYLDLPSLSRDLKLFNYSLKNID